MVEMFKVFLLVGTAFAIGFVALGLPLLSASIGS
jgi:hypothetical protein